MKNTLLADTKLKSLQPPQAFLLHSLPGLPNPIDATHSLNEHKKLSAGCAKALYACTYVAAQAPQQEGEDERKERGERRTRSRTGRRGGAGAAREIRG